MISYTIGVLGAVRFTFDSQLHLFVLSLERYSNPMRLVSRKLPSFLCQCAYTNFRVELLLV